MPHPDMNGGHRDDQHPDEGLLHEWLDDQLSPVDAAEMQSHIASCAACGARVAEARGLIAASRRILTALDDVPSGVIPASFSATSGERSTVSDADADADAGDVVSIESARKTVRTPVSKRAFTWQRAASIAALLLVAVTVTRLRTSNLEQSIPVATVASEARPEVSSAPAAREAATPPDDASAGASASASASASARTAAAPAALASEVRARVADASIADSASVRGVVSAKAKPEQVASAKSGAREQATDAAKKTSEQVAADAGGSVAASPVVANAASPVVANAAPPAAVVASVPLPLVAGQLAARADATTRGAAVGGGGGGGRGGGRGGLAASAFDSVTLARTECSPACESTSLHINASGLVRYVVGVGNSQRVVMSQLSALERTQLQTLVSQSFSSPALQRGRTICSSSPATSERRNLRDTAPEVQLLVDLPGSSTLRPEEQCAKSEAELREIGARVDAIAGTDALKRRVPPLQ